MVDGVLVVLEHLAHPHRADHVVDQLHGGVGGAAESRIGLRRGVLLAVVVGQFLGLLLVRSLRELVLPHGRGVRRSRGRRGCRRRRRSGWRRRWSCWSC